MAIIRGMYPLAIHSSETICLEHQRPEDRPSSRGLVCAECHARLIAAPPQGAICSYWESQPAAYTLDGEPCWVYSLVWSDFRIRSLHLSGQQGLPYRETGLLTYQSDATDARKSSQITESLAD
ncbi:MAG: hypothetical protein JWN70_1825 [Planctomycetaceae bacterium]|nr:hypothetical protein [Planctomycetaceae bacterium]